MLHLITQMLDDPAQTESRLLRGLLQDTPEIPDWSAAVQPVLTKLLERNQIRRPMIARVVKMPFNALALPHQTIIVAQSLVEFCRDKRDQMAFILAHEAAHIHLSHAWERSRTNALMSLLGSGNMLAGMGLRFLLNRTFSREQEFQADRQAVAFCLGAGYDPRAGITLLQRFAAAAPSVEGLKQLLDTHPPLRDRIAEIGSALGQ